MSLFDILYPRTCPFCGRYISNRQIDEEHIEWLCVDCWKHLPRTEQDILPENSTETTLTDGRSDNKEAMRLEKAAAYLFFEKLHPIQHVIHRMKYSDEPMLGYWLARQALLDWRDDTFFEDFDLVVPMPLHPKRMRERGYNQAEYIAKAICELTGVPMDTTHVVRVRNTPKQAKLTESNERLSVSEMRKSNVANAFAVLHPEELKGKHILVVDDLITTGETMKSCLHAMKRIRGARFSVFALCKA